MTLRRSPTLKEAVAAKWSTALSHHLAPGENVWALARTSSFRPLFDGLAVTNTRVVAFAGTDAARKGPKIEVSASEITHVEFQPFGSSRRLIVRTRSQGDVSLGLLPVADADFVAHYLRYLLSDGPTAGMETEPPARPPAPPSAPSASPHLPSHSISPAQASGSSPRAKKMSKTRKGLLWAGAVVAVLFVLSVATSPEQEEDSPSRAVSSPASSAMVTSPTAAAVPPSPQTPSQPVAPRDPAEMVPGIDYPPDEVFLLNLELGDIYYSSAENAIQVATMTCDKLAEGIDPVALQIIAVQAGGYSAYDAGYFIGAAVNAYCPQYEHLLN